MISLRRGRRGDYLTLRNRGDKFAKLAATKAGTIFLSYFDERGISRKYDVTVEADGFIMRRTDPKFSQRMTYRLEAGGNRIVSKGEMSRDGGAWDLSTTYERV